MSLLICSIGAALPATSESIVLEVGSCISADWTGFKIVRDNVDKNFRPSTQQYDNETNPWFHLHAVKDRIDLSSYSDYTPNSAAIDINKLLIHKDDVKQITSNADTLISR